MRSISIALFALPLALLAQETHIVEVGGSTAGAPIPVPFYAPATLTIPVGDIVRWTNVSGTHNVNGTMFIYPGNPEDFYSGETDNGAWTFAHTFTIPGVYNYRCDSKGHAETQTGVINVTAGNGLREQAGTSAIVAFPTPATAVLMADVGSRIIAKAEIIGVEGRLISTLSVNAGQVLQFPVAELPPGNYFLRLTNSAGLAESVRFTKR